jgi:hypothetical protein
MKNGFFRSFKAFTLGLVFFSLSGCATLFDLAADEDPADYDRGYGLEEQAELADNTESDGFDRSPASAPENNFRLKRAIEARDIILGMTRQDVMRSWGEPVQREVAGTRDGGHERWTYGTRYKFSGSRTVIFENGRVAGWNR